MTIKTKYSLLTKVWRMNDNKPQSDIIWSIEPTITQTHDRGSSTIIKYRFEENGRLYIESELFETKEALLQSL